MDKRIETLLEIEKHAQEIMNENKKERARYKDKIIGDCMSIEKASQAKIEHEIRMIRWTEKKVLEKVREEVEAKTNLEIKRLEKQYREQLAKWTQEIVAAMIGW